MRRTLGFCVVICCLFLFSQPATAQMGPGMGIPSVRGLWKPVVGSGAAYLIDSKREGKQEIEYAVVGADTADGKPGHWLEISIPAKSRSAKDPEVVDLMVVRQLMVQDGKQTRMLRMVVQNGNEDPMEMPMEMMGMMGQRQEPQKADAREDAERVGTETITTPAGTFECEHWRVKDQSSDVWFSDKAGPYGLVKMASRDSNMTLIRVFNNAKTKIRGTPKKFDPSGLPRRP
jgi:hypothetical protein